MACRDCFEAVIPKGQKLEWYKRAKVICKKGWWLREGNAQEKTTTLMTIETNSPLFQSYYDTCPHKNEEDK